MDYLWDNYEFKPADKAEPWIVEVMIKEESERALVIAVNKLQL